MSNKQTIGGGRASGKTYRACLMALFKASDGERVIIVARYPVAVWHTIQMIVPWGEFIDRAQRQVRFPNGGSVIILSSKDVETKTMGIKAEFIYD